MKCATQRKFIVVISLKTQKVFCFIELSKREGNLQSKFSAAAGDRGLIILKRNKHFKSRDINIKEFLTIEIFHLISAMHSSHFCP